MRINCMIGTAANHLTFSASVSALPSQATGIRRRIGPAAGLALEKLGHAIEYLTDEFMHEESFAPSGRDGRLEAIEILMAVANRSITTNALRCSSLSASAWLPFFTGTSNQYSSSRFKTGPPARSDPVLFFQCGPRCGAGTATRMSRSGKYSASWKIAPWMPRVRIEPQL